MVVTSAAQVGAKMARLGAVVEKAQTKAAEAASAVLKAGVEAASPRRVRNAGKNGAALTVRVKATPGKVPTSTGTAIGPWALVEYPTPTHLIGIGRATTGRGAGRTRAKVKVRNGAAVGGYLHSNNYTDRREGNGSGVVRGPIVHPGTKGKLLFHKGVYGATPKAVEALARSTTLSAREVFG